jgi:hypothetical protein
MVGRERYASNGEIDPGALSHTTVESWYDRGTAVSESASFCMHGYRKVYELLSNLVSIRKPEMGTSEFPIQK